MSLKLYYSFLCGKALATDRRKTWLFEFLCSLYRLDSRLIRLTVSNFENFARAKAKNLGDKGKAPIRFYCKK
jgi:hypothetical protein